MGASALALPARLGGSSAATRVGPSRDPGSLSATARSEAVPTLSLLPFLARPTTESVFADLMDLCAPDSLVRGPEFGYQTGAAAVEFGYRLSTATAIYAGTSEIMKSIVAQVSLGMPRSESMESGGSQIFVTHRPTPHLDGRYTIFGELRDGDRVLDAIAVGDRIVRVRRSL